MRSTTSTAHQALSTQHSVHPNHNLRARRRRAAKLLCAQHSVITLWHATPIKKSSETAKHVRVLDCLSVLVIVLLMTLQVLPEEIANCDESDEFKHDRSPSWLCVLSRIAALPFGRQDRDL